MSAILKPEHLPEQTGERLPPVERPHREHDVREGFCRTCNAEFDPNTCADGVEIEDSTAVPPLSLLDLGE